MKSQQAQLFTTPDGRVFEEKRLFFEHIIEDRGSKYSVLAIGFAPTQDPQRYAKLFSHSIKKEKFFRQATHNSYARRYERRDGVFLEGSNDDGEKGAGLCILRELRQAQVTNGLVLVTRYYGGVKLEGDRFRHVIDATKYILKNM